MISKIKTVLLAVFFMLTAAISMYAQDKYEYAVINYTPFSRNLTISINGNDYKAIDVPKEDVKGSADVNPAIKEMNKMLEDNWELLDTEVTTYSTTFYKSYDFILRRKK